LEEMLLYGCAQIEIEVQLLYESITRETNWRHTMIAVCHSFQLAKDCGSKVMTHMMLDLPMGMEGDLAGFKEYLRILCSIVMI
jgi:elongator complex protein 3